MTKYIVKSYLALVNRFDSFAKNLGSFGLAIIYTIGHIWIAILCAAYMVYLGFKIIGSFTTVKVDSSRPIKFHEAALFQIVNPKAWTISSMAASSFIINEINLIFSIFVIANSILSMSVESLS